MADDQDEGIEDDRLRLILPLPKDYDPAPLAPLMGGGRIAGLVLPPEVLVNARMSSLIGPGYDVRIVNRFIARFLADEPVSIQGGDQVFDFMDVRDAARALIAVALAGPPEGSTALNIGGGAPRTLRDIAQTVADVVRTHTEHEPRIDWEPSAGDDRTLGLDSGILSRHYNFSPRYRLEESAHHILDGLLRSSERR